MIFWKGKGLLIPLFALAGYILAPGTARGPLGAVPAFWFAAAAVWIFALTIGKTARKVYIEPATNREVVFKEAHTLYFLPPLFWAIALTGLAAVMTVVKIVGPNNETIVATASEQPYSKAAFDRANALIQSKGNTIAHGNNDEAIALARAFSEACRQRRDIAIEKSGDDFLTYVHRTPGVCVFLVHVPDLRHFSREAKDTMADICWLTAQQLTAKLTSPPAKLALGIRGALLFDRAYIGRIQADLNDNSHGVYASAERSESKELLAPLFDEQTPPAPAPQKTPAAIATKTSAPAAKESATTPPQTPPALLTEVPAKTTPKLPTAFRDWKSDDGRPMHASLLRFVDGTRVTAEFRRKDGHIFQVPVDRFSPEDEKFIRSLPLK
jgi:hypothetical protein